MNKRTLNKIISLHKDGISFELAASMIIDLSKTSNEAADWIAQFISIRAPQLWHDMHFKKLEDAEKDLISIKDV